MRKRFEIPLPKKGEALALAKKLAGGNEIRLRILQALLARPQRYSELRTLLRGRGDETLNRALRDLLNDGILDQRSDVSRDPPIDVYGLSDLGVRVVLTLAERAVLERLARLAHGNPHRFADAVQS